MMAVARIKGTAEWLVAAAEALKPIDPRGAKALMRASEQRSLVAELNEDETRRLLTVLPDDPTVINAVTIMEDVLVREQERAKRVRANMDLRRGRA